MQGLQQRQQQGQQAPTKEQAQIDYYLILHGWNCGEPTAVLFAALERWIETYFSLIQAKDEIFDILGRMGDDDRDAIVEDFVHGSVYPKLRAEFTI